MKRGNFLKIISYEPKETQNRRALNSPNTKVLRHCRKARTALKLPITILIWSWIWYFDHFNSVINRTDHCYSKTASRLSFQGPVLSRDKQKPLGTEDTVFSKLHKKLLTETETQSFTCLSLCDSFQLKKKRQFPNLKGLYVQVVTFLWQS